MALLIDPSLVSYSLIKNKILTYVKNKPDGEAWKDFFDSSAGNILIELLAGTSTYLTYNAIASRRETYLNYAKNRTSAIGIAENLAYNVSRGKNAHVQLVVVSSDTITINKWDIVGMVTDVSLIAWQTVTLYPSVPTVIECVVGDLVSDVTYEVTSSSTDVFRIVANGVSDDVRLLFKKTTVDPYTDLDKENAMSTRIIDLINDKYVLLTNPYDSVDIYYLNNKPTILNVGDEIRLTTSGTLPAPLVQNTPYYVIPRGENLISLASIEINAYNDIPIDITTVGTGIHLINSTYSFTLNGYEDNNINPVGLTTNSIAVDGIFPKYQYGNGTTLRLDYVQLRNVVFDLPDVEFYYGTIQFQDSRTKILSPYQVPETINNIKVNAPLYFETQFLIKGREDFKKVFKQLDSTFIDTNGRDLSPAIVEVTYLKDDLTLLNLEQKLIKVTELNKYRPFGFAPTQIADPLKVDYKLSINLLLYTGVTLPVIEQEIQNVLTYEQSDGYVTPRQKRLAYELDLYQLEHEINNLVNADGQKYIQITRLSMYTETYAINTPYKRGDFVTHASNSTYMFECVKTLGKNLKTFTTDFCNVTVPTYLTTGTSHGLVTGQAIKVYRTGSGSLPSPLSDYNIYYVNYKSATQLTLSLTPNGSDVRLLNNGSGIIGTNNIVTGFVFTTNYLVNPTYITINSHGLQNNQTVNVYSDKTLPTPLSENTVYYVNVINSNNIELRTSPTGTSIAFQDNGTSGAIHTLHTAVLQGLSGGSTPSFGAVTSEGTLLIDNEVIWRSKLKTATDFNVDWNEYIIFDFDYQTI